MKRILLTVLVLLICVNAFAVKEKIITLNSKDEWSRNENQLIVDVFFDDANSLILRFDNTKDYDPWTAIDPFSIIFLKENISEFRNVLDKFFEWDNVAIQNNVCDVEKNMNHRISAYDFSYVRNSNKSKLFIICHHNYYNSSYSFDSYYVKRLRDAISEESLKKIEEKFLLRKKQTELFN